MPVKKERIVFDANFFICMMAIKAGSQVLVNLDKAAKDLRYDYHISEVVFDEVKGPVAFKNKLRAIVFLVYFLEFNI